MAKTQAPAPQALEKRGIAALERPAFIKTNDTRGTENIGSNDIRPPSLRLAQSGSPEAKRSEAQYIDGLAEGNFFNSLTKQIYGEGPIQVVIVNQLGHRNVQFDPNDKKVVLDFNVPDGDPRTAFSTQVVDGVEKRVKPAATTFYDYLVYVINGEQRELMTLSLKSTQLKKAKDLNTLLKTSKLASFSFLFEVTAEPERRGANSWWGWVFTAAGYVTEDIYNDAAKLYEQMAGKTVVVETEEGDGEGDEKIPF